MGFTYLEFHQFINNTIIQNFHEIQISMSFTQTRNYLVNEAQAKQ